MKFFSLLIGLSAICFLLISCEKEPEPVVEEPVVEEPVEVDTGERLPQHGGMLLVLGDEAGYIEIVVDSVEGKITAYLLDGMAKDPMGLDQSSIDLELIRRVLVGKGVEVVTYDLTLASENENNSTFSVVDSRLKDIDSFQGNLGSITIDGESYTGTSFSYPQ